MIEQQRPDRRETPQIIFVWRVIAVPGDDVERRMIEVGRPERPAPFHVEGAFCVALLVMRCRRQEVSGIGKAIGADRPAFRQRQRTSVIFAQVSARETVDQFDTHLHATWDDRDLARRNFDDSEFGGEPERALLRHEQ